MRDCPYGICYPWVRGGWDLDALGKFFRRRRRPRLKNRFSKCVAFLHTFAHCSILRFCHERGQNKRWGAARHVKRSGFSIRVYSVLENIVTISKYSQTWSNMFENLVKQSEILKIGICQKQKFVGHVQKVFLERLGLFRTNSGKKSLKTNSMGVVRYIF